MDMYRRLMFAFSFLFVSSHVYSEKVPSHHKGHVHPPGAANKHMHKHRSVDGLIKRFDDPKRAKWQKPQQVLNYFKPLKGKVIADIGAGSGYFSFLLAEKGATVLAIDVDQRFLTAIEKKKSTHSKGKQVTTVLSKPGSTGLSNGQADGILIVNTVHHMENRIALYKKMKQGLKPSGKLIIVDYKKKGKHGPPKRLRLSIWKAKKELKKAGFHVKALKSLPRQYVLEATVPVPKTPRKSTPSQ